MGFEKQGTPNTSGRPDAAGKGYTPPEKHADRKATEDQNVRTTQGSDTTQPKYDNKNVHTDKKPDIDAQRHPEEQKVVSKDFAQKERTNQTDSASNQRV
jgi:hypothetical protein